MTTAKTNSPKFPRILMAFLLANVSCNLGVFSFLTRNVSLRIRSPFRTPASNVPLSILTESKTDDTRSDTFHVALSIPTRDAMEEMGALLSVVTRPPDVITLDGDLGAGKTCFARGFIRCKLGVEEEDDDDGSERSTLQVTSPTYLLSNTYPYQDEKNGVLREIHHMDLYRLPGTSSKEFEPLALLHVFSHCISLIEWPSRMAGFPEVNPPKKNLLQVDMTIRPSSDERIVTLTASAESSWRERLKYLMDEGMLDDLLIEEEN